MATNSASKKQKVKRVGKVGNAVICITLTRNNILVVVSDVSGNVLVSGSSGKSSFKGQRKATPFACKTVVSSVVEEAKKLYSIKTVMLKFHVCNVMVLKSVGASAAESIDSADVIISEIRAFMPVAHAGCRLPGRRSV